MTGIVMKILMQPKQTATGNYNNAYTKVICNSLGGCLSY